MKFAYVYIYIYIYIYIKIILYISKINFELANLKQSATNVSLFKITIRINSEDKTS